MNRGLALAIEISNPSSGPRGRIDPARPDFVAGPSVAIGRFDASHGVEIVGAEPLSESSRHDDDLMPAIDRLCLRCNVQPRDLEHIAASVGPGGYTSLRIAVATASMLAEAIGASTIPVRSAPAAAWLIQEQTPAVVCIASKGQNAWCELLPPPQNDRWWVETGSDALRSLLPARELASLKDLGSAGRSWIAAGHPIGILDAAAIELLRPRLLIADRFLPEAMREAAKAVGAEVLEPIFAAESVLHIAIDTSPVDPLNLAPLYPREAEAVTQWRRRGEGK